MLSHDLKNLGSALRLASCAGILSPEMAEAAAEELFSHAAAAQRLESLPVPGAARTDLARLPPDVLAIARKTAAKGACVSAPSKEGNRR